MRNLLKIFFILRTLKKGKEGRFELMEDLSFGFMENLFFLSFFVLGIIIGAFFYLAYAQKSVLALVFAIIFSIIFILDLSIYLKLKRFLKKALNRVMDFEKVSIFRRETKVVDVEELKSIGEKREL